MRIEEIPAHEADFDANHKDSNEKIFQYSNESIQIPGETGVLEYVNLKPLSGDNSYYYKSQQEKYQIVLHYTIGYLKGDIATLTQPDYHVSVPFVIGRNGNIYNLFFSGYWAYHLGPGAIGGNKTQSKRTLGIELSNIGGLYKTNQGMENYYKDIYCDDDQYDAYLSQSFRRFDFYASFTENQYNSLITLLRYLTARYNIKRDFLPESERFATIKNIVNFNGIVSHINYRKSGKEDIGPAFDWERVIGGVTR
jgi:N-acetyl-anhydromuramyl-L-alanine amidase AmpD